MTFRERFDTTHNMTVDEIGESTICVAKCGYEDFDAERCRTMPNCKFCWDRKMPTENSANALTVKEESDNVNHPKHYTLGGIECIDAIEAATNDLTGAEAFLTGQVMKYLWRWKWKNGLEDLQKAKWYLDRLIGKVSKA